MNLEQKILALAPDKPLRVYFSQTIDPRNARSVNRLLAAVHGYQTGTAQSVFTSSASQSSRFLQPV
jgi:hypothetical protein